LTIVSIDDHFLVQIAIKLFDNAIKTLDILSVTFDSWYASVKYLEHTHKKEKFFFSEIKSNRNIFMYHPAKKTHCMVPARTTLSGWKPDELATLIKKYYWHKIKYVNTKLSVEVDFHIKHIRSRLNLRIVKFSLSL
jgi:hypothetical protein